MDKHKMTIEQARRIVGNQGDVFLRNMVAALKMCPWLNAAEDNLRLQAAQIILSSRSK